MKTAYGKLTALLLLLVAGLLLFAPMRSGLEDHLYAYPRSLKMSKGDAFDITYLLDSDHAQTVSYSSVDERVARVNQQGRVTAVSPGKTQIHLRAQDGARTLVQVEVAGRPATSLTLNVDSLAMEKGQVTGLRAIFNADAEDTLVQWVSENSRVAQVDAVGRVAAVGGGKTRVVASAPNGLTASAEVSVHVSGNAVRITPEDVTVGTGATFQMGTYYLPEDTTDTISHWASSDPAVLSVQPDGFIHAVSEGSAVLSVYTEAGLSGSTVITVERGAGGFDISPNAATIERGNVLKLQPRFTDAEGRPDGSLSGHYIAWSSSDPTVATVEDGAVTGLKTGTTRITASADGMTATCDLQVVVLVHEVRLNLDEVYLLREQADAPIQLLATVVPADADEPDIAFSTSNELVAQVTPDGLVTFSGYGTAIITARARSGAEARFVANIVARLPDADAEDAPPEAGPPEAATHADELDGAEEDGAAGGDIAFESQIDAADVSETATEGMPEED